MRNEHFDAFAASLDGACRLLSRNQYEPNPASTAIFFKALAEYPLEAVRAALDNHVRTSRFVPVPADLLDFLRGDDGRDGRPGAEEAWATAMRCRDERETVVWTSEMSTAWGVAAVLVPTDDIGARMAFREVYEREVKQARAAGRPLKWNVLFGHDQARRAEAVKRAQAEGKVIDGTALEVLDYTPARGPVALLRAPSGTAERSRAEVDGRAKLRELARRLKAGFAEAERANVEAKELTAEAAARTAARVAAYAVQHRIPMKPLTMPRPVAQPTEEAKSHPPRAPKAPCQWDDDLLGLGQAPAGAQCTPTLAPTTKAS